MKTNLKTLLKVAEDEMATATYAVLKDFTKELRDLTKDPDCCSYDCSLITEILGE